MGYPQNRELVGDLRPRSEADWLLVAGDVGERLPDIEWALRHAQRAVRHRGVGAGQP